MTVARPGAAVRSTIVMCSRGAYVGRMSEDQKVNTSITINGHQFWLAPGQDLDYLGRLLLGESSNPDVNVQPDPSRTMVHLPTRDDQPQVIVVINNGLVAVMESYSADDTASSV